MYAAYICMSSIFLWYRNMAKEYIKIDRGGIGDSGSLIGYISWNEKQRADQFFAAPRQSLRGIQTSVMLQWWTATEPTLLKTKAKQKNTIESLPIRKFPFYTTTFGLTTSTVYFFPPFLFFLFCFIHKYWKNSQTFAFLETAWAFSLNWIKVLKELDKKLV